LNGVPDAFGDGEIGKLQSIVPGSGPDGIKNNPLAAFGDDPNLPRDPDKFDGPDNSQREFSYRNVPSGLAHEIYLDAYERLASFEPQVSSLDKRLYDAYAAEDARVESSQHPREMLIHRRTASPIISDCKRLKTSEGGENDPFAKLLYGLTPVPRVRIPPSPPLPL
jgi:hypothetical protein